VSAYAYCVKADQVHGPVSVIVLKPLVVVTVGTPLIVVDIVTIVSMVSTVENDCLRASEALTVVAGTTDSGVIEAVRKKSNIELLNLV
jgi:hypothetical protein